VIAAALFAGCASIVLAQSVITPTSSTVNPGDAGVRAHTNIQILPAGNFTGTPSVSGPPFPGLLYQDPASLACIYNLQPPPLGISIQPSVPGCNPNLTTQNPSGGRKAIAIVDAYDDPNAYTDLQTFSSQFGVAAINPSSFVVVFAPSGGAAPGSCTGPATRPAVDPTGGWEIEESLDIEYAHAMAPGATLYLVEAQSNNFSDLFCAVTVASTLVHAAGGGEVSMSWGSGEFSKETSFDSVFTTANIVYFASAGDSPGVSYPSSSPNVISVGGTTLSMDPVTGNFIGENVWQVAGGGPSAFEPRPAYQNGVSSIVGGSRGTPDISSDANPNTGVWVLDNFMAPAGCTPQCWYIVGGTSVSSPTWAGIVNAANSFAASSNAELTKLYADPHGYFNDITIGSCGPYMGYFAIPGWDFCSGLGSPRTYSGK
jgi:subtilase family serine protease